MHTDLPDVLMEDIFAEIARLPPEADITPDAVMKSDVFQEDIRDKTPDDKVQAPPRTLSQIIDGLPDRVKFFALTCNPSSSTTSNTVLACDACGLQLRKSSVFVRCAECCSPVVDLCTHCFANGAEFGAHLRSHPYVVVNARSSQLMRHSKPISKLDIRELLRCMKSVERKGSLNFAELEKNLNIDGDGERLYLDLVSMFSSCDEQLRTTLPESDQSGDAESSLSGGPANFNVLRDEFEHDYVPEAETLLAAVHIGKNEPDHETLTSLFEGYNGILDERERRKKFLKSSNLVNLKEFYNVLRKRKTDEKEMFEKLRIFIRPVLSATNSPSSTLAWLETLALTLTSRKRLMDRLKRLAQLKRHGIRFEAAEGSQFDTDRKKRGDLIARRGGKIWTALPSVPVDGKRDPLSPEQALGMLYGSELLRTREAVDACIELQIAPQHFLVLQSAVHAILKSRSDVTDECLAGVIQDGVFGTIRRHLLTSQGLAVSSTALALPAGIDELKARLIHLFRSSFSQPSR